MEPYAAEWWSIVPPIVAIGLALLTKEVFSSLLVGIFTGTLIYAVGTDANIVTVSYTHLTLPTNSRV